MRTRKIKQLGIVLLLIIVYTFVFINTSLARETPEEILVEVTKNGIVSQEEKENAGRLEDILTLKDDTIRDGYEMYTEDSKDAEGGTGTKQGSSIVGDIGYIPVYEDEKGERHRLEEVKISVVDFDNLTNDELATLLADHTNSDKSTILSYMDMENTNYLASIWGEYGVTEYELTIKFHKDGTYEIEIPKDFNDGLFAVIGMVDPVTGKTITLANVDRKFFEIGDRDANQDTEKPTDDEETEIIDDKIYRYYGTTTNTKNFQHLNGQASGDITNSKYNVSTAIPTSENLNFNSFNIDDTLFDITVRNRKAYAGVRDIQITTSASYYYDCDCYKYDYVTHKGVNGNEYKSWEIVGVEHPGERHIGTITYSDWDKFSFEASKYYFDVPKSNMFPVLEAIMGGAPTASEVKISLKGGPSVGAQTLNVYAKLPAVSKVENAYTGVFETRTDAADISVHRALYEQAKSRIQTACWAAIGCKGSVNYSYRGLNVTTNSSNNVMPSVVKTSGTKTEMIPSNKLNGNYSTYGVVNYSGGFTTELVPNDVFVHTPVVNNTTITTSEFINQKINKTAGTTYLMLDEEFTVTISDWGTHNNYKGYGNRKYNSYQAVPGTATNWGKIKDVKLPFDAYLHTSSGKVFIPANAWISEKGYATANNSYKFTLPVWVKETSYTIETRVIAENATDYGLVQWGANYDSGKYVAGMETKVEVIGKIYDLRISGTNDPAWSILSEKTGNKYITAEEFPFGQDGQNINTKYNYAPKLGYTFVFDFKTKGTKSNNVDVNISEEGFYFVSKDGGEAVPVDLYYHTTTNKYIKIGSSNDTTKLKVNLKNSFMNVASQELIDSVRIKQGKYNYSQDVNVGGFSKMNLTENLRLCYNNLLEYATDLNGDKLYGNTKKTIINNATSEDRIIESVGHWYAGYRLPASTKAVSIEQTINEAVSNNSFLSGGYILVKFNIVTRYKNTVGDWEYLEYMGPESINDKGELAVDWTDENATQEITLPNGKTATVPFGVVAMYETDLRSSNDVENSGTH